MSKTHTKRLYIILFKRDGTTHPPERFYITAQHKHDATRIFNRVINRDLYRILNVEVKK